MNCYSQTEKKWSGVLNFFLFLQRSSLKAWSVLIANSLIHHLQNHLKKVVFQLVR